MNPHGREADSAGRMRQAFRASILHCLADPGEASLDSACEYLSDGLLIVENGVVAELGEAASPYDAMISSCGK